jgi:para-nitrobenzyl esterase
MTADAHSRLTEARPVVETTYGPVRGTDDGTVKAWKGVRYAAAPVGELRWAAPQPPAPCSEVADATRVGPVVPQPTDPRIPIDLGAPQAEDSLRLNVWAPSGTAAGDDKPVLVWVHGGAYVLGSANQPLYHGRALATGGDVVVVTLNYRLGAFGFLDLSTFGDPRFASNCGLRDVLSALHWVRDNIAAFGGDPDRVTLFGESAGGGIVTSLLTSPAADGLFARAIAQSSPVTSVYDANRGRRLAERFLEQLGLGADDVAKLPDLPLPTVLAASKRLFDEVPARNPGTLAFAPIVDGDVLPEHPVDAARAGRSHPVPLIIGTNKHEAALFRWMRSPLLPITPEAIKAMFAQIEAEQPTLQIPSEAQIGSAYPRLRGKRRGMGVARDIGFRMPSLWFADGHSQVAPVYVYRFDWSAPLLRLIGLGAAHATELPYVWGNLVMGPKDPTFKLGGLKTGRELSERIRRRWVNFATSGDPSTGDSVWRPYRAEDRASLVLDKQDRLVSDLDNHLFGAWGDQVLDFR